MTATVSTPPISGTLSLSDNGSFSYTPETGYNGLITFTYKAQTEASVGSGTFNRVQSMDDRFVLNLGDLDGDGDLDIFTPNDSSYGPGVLFNNGDGTFADGQAIEENEFSSTGELGDIDGDGDLDALVFNDDDFSVYYNNGNGYFSASVMGSFGDSRVLDFLLEDLDGDNDLDIWLSTGDPTGAYVFLINDGQSNFTEAQSFSAQPANFQLASGDIDNDGDIDVVGGKIFINEGNGNFVVGPQNYTNPLLPTVMGYFNGDAYLDIFVTDGADSYVLMNEGAAGPGGFDQANAISVPTPWYWKSNLAVADIDNDGDADIIGEGILLNDGTGVFTLSSEIIKSTTERIEAIGVGDLDGNGTVDIAFVDYDLNGNGEYLNVLFNQTEIRQLESEATVRIIVGDVPGPVDVTITNNGVVTENLPISSTVGTLETLDPTSSNHTYTLVAGAGSNDNGEFAIVGDQLITNAIFDYEAGQSPTRRVRVHTTNGQFSFEKSLTIVIANEEPEPSGPPDQCNGSNLTLYDSGDGKQSSIISNVAVSNLTPLGCDVTGTLTARLNGQDIFTQPFTGNVNRWNRLFSATDTLENFTFDVAGVVVQTEKVTLIEYGGRLYIRIRHAEVCAPAEWGGDCVDGTPANLRLDDTGLFAGTGGVPMPDFVINQAPGLEYEFARQNSQGSFLSLLKLSAKATGTGLKDARIVEVDGGYEITAGFSLALPKVPVEKKCGIVVSITLFKDSNGVVTMTMEPLPSKSPDALEFREGTLGLNCNKGIPLGNTGLQLSGVSGTISLRPDIQYVSLDLEITPITGGSTLFKIEAGAKLFWQPIWGVDLDGSATVFKVFEVSRFHAEARETQMSFTGYIRSSYIRGDVELFWFSVKWTQALKNKSLLTTPCLLPK